MLENGWWLKLPRLLSRRNLWSDANQTLIEWEFARYSLTQLRTHQQAVKALVGSLMIGIQSHNMQRPRPLSRHPGQKLWRCSQPWPLLGIMESNPSHSSLTLKFLSTRSSDIRWTWRSMACFVISISSPFHLRQSSLILFQKHLMLELTLLPNRFYGPWTKFKLRMKSVCKKTIQPI